MQVTNVVQEYSNNSSNETLVTDSPI